MDFDTASIFKKKENLHDHYKSLQTSESEKLSILSTTLLFK